MNNLKAVAPDSPKRDYESIIDRIKTSLWQLENYAGIIENQLAPILVNEGANGQTSEPKPAHATDLARQLDALFDEVVKIEERFGSISRCIRL